VLILFLLYFFAPNGQKKQKYYSNSNSDSESNSDFESNSDSNLNEKFEDNLVIDVSLESNLELDDNFSSNMYNNINSWKLLNDKILFFDIFARNNTLIIICPLYNDFDAEHNTILLYINNQLINMSRYITNPDNEKLHIRFYDIKIPEYEKFIVNVTYNNITNEYNLCNYIINTIYELTATTLFKDDYKLINIWYNYYNDQGIEHYYLYYNGILTEEIKSYYNKKNVILLEWNYPYWNNNIYLDHVAQVGQINHALYKYGKVYSNYMIFCDFDEFMYIPKYTLYNFIKLYNNYDAFLFLNRWARTIDNIIPNILPNTIFLSKEIFKPYDRSKCIYKNSAIDYVQIHGLYNMIMFNSNDLYSLHFKNWSNPNRYIEDDLDNLEILNIIK
jgi:hypothetical protein